MSHTSTSIHNVVAIITSDIRHADNHRWQKIDMTMSDGSTHSISVFLEPDAKSLVATKVAYPASAEVSEELQKSIREARMNLQGRGVFPDADKGAS